MINSIIDYRVPFGTATDQLIQWNNTAKRFEATTTITGITLGSPWTLDGDGTWTGPGGFSALDCSDGPRKVIFDDDSVILFITVDGSPVLSLYGDGIEFGDPSQAHPFDFIGTGLTTLGGNILVNGGFIGDTDDDELIEIDGAGGVVTVDGDILVTGTYNTMAFDVFGTDSMKIGVDAGLSGTGTACVFVGAMAGSNNTADNNVGIGYRSCGGNGAGNTGGNNVCVGYRAMELGTTAQRNFALGGNSLALATTSSDNVAIGNDVLKWITTSEGRNVGIGFGALVGSSGATAKKNVSVGYAAGNATKLGFENTSIGYLAGSGMTDGFRNTLIGSECSRSLLTGDLNTCIGYRSGQLLTGNFNTLLGTQTGDNLTTADYAIVIGYDIDTGDDATDYQLNIGGFIAGNWNASAPWLSVDGNVRIGDTTAPTEALEVAGNAVATGDVSGATLTAGDGFTGTGAFTNFTITKGIITAAS